jgi:hypothetical protein
MIALVECYPMLYLCVYISMYLCIDHTFNKGSLLPKKYRWMTPLFILIEIIKKGSQVEGHANLF